MMVIHFIRLAKYICVTLSLIQTICASYSGRDIILTPNKTQQHYGKIIFFKPIDKEFTSKQRSLKENIPPSQVLWEEPLKHATYLVLNNKIDGVDNSSDFVSEAELQAATYVRRAYRSYPKFGDIVSLARGRLETDDNKKFVYIEMDRNECKQLNCSLSENDNKNISAFWLVEKVRHRDEKQVHRYELRITIFPTKKLRLENRQGATSARNQTKKRSFLIREQDYPKYFDETMKTNNKIQKRFFDLVGSLSENPYEEYRIPFTVGGFQNAYPEDLNTGEYYQPKRNGEQYHHVPIATTNSHGGQIQFPDAIVATKDFLEATRKYPVNPLTSTHLHHHYYLNRNNVPLVKATGYEKETVFENENSDYGQQVHVQTPQIHDVSTRNHQQSDQKYTTKVKEPNAAPQNNIIPTAIGVGYNFYTETPRTAYDVSGPSNYIFSNNQNLQTPYSLSDQVPAPPLQFNQFYQQTPYSHPLQLQVVTPPAQYTGNSPITATPFNIEQLYPIQPFRPVIDFPSSFNRQQFPIQNNDVNYNQQFEPNRYSEPDPIYHGENVPLSPYTRQVGFDPVIDIGNHHHQQQSSPNQIQNTKPEQYTPNTGDYEINPSNMKKRPEENHGETQSEKLQQKHSRNESQTKYPDSINAQLPPPEQDDDLTVPYVESSVVTQTSIVQSTSVESNNYHKHSTSYEKPKRIRPRGYAGPRTTTEKPILKWMPKKTKPTEFLFENDGANTSTFPNITDPVITVTPVSSHSEEEPRTSVSTSVSIKVGLNSGTTDSNQSAGSTYNSTGSRELEQRNVFLPTMIPNSEFIRDRIEAVQTNSSKF